MKHQPSDQSKAADATTEEKVEAISSSTVDDDSRSQRKGEDDGNSGEEEQVADDEEDDVQEAAEEEEESLEDVVCCDCSVRSKALLDLRWRVLVGRHWRRGGSRGREGGINDESVLSALPSGKQSIAFHSIDRLLIVQCVCAVAGKRGSLVDVPGHSQTKGREHRSS